MAFIPSIMDVASSVSLSDFRGPGTVLVWFADAVSGEAVPRLQLKSPLLSRTLNFP